MMIVNILVGFVLLLGAAEFLVRGAVGVAERLGVSKLVIGLTIVAMGTSTPELLVSLKAAFLGAPGIAVGNVVGSNIANVLLILGFSALVAPIATRAGALAWDGVRMIAATAFFAVMCAGGFILRWEGWALLVAFAAFLGFEYFLEKRSRGEAVVLRHQAEEFKSFAGSPWKAWAALVAGLAGVAFGADLLVAGGVELARWAGMSEAVIGLTLIAVGTSLPELAASGMAAYRGHTDVALGNVLGSNMFNMLGIAGTVAAVRPIPVDEQFVVFDLWVMLFAAIAMLPILMRGHLGRVGGIFFLLVYAVYVGVQVVGVDRVLKAIG